MICVILMVNQTYLHRIHDLMVSGDESKTLRSTPTNLSVISELSTRSKVSTVSEISLLASSTLSKISQKSQPPLSGWRSSKTEDSKIALFLLFTCSGRSIKTFKSTGASFPPQNRQLQVTGPHISGKYLVGEVCRSNCMTLLLQYLSFIFIAPVNQSSYLIDFCFAV